MVESIWFIAVIAIYSLFVYPADPEVIVYNGLPFQGFPVSHNVFKQGGRIESHTTLNGYCYDNVTLWCDDMIIKSGAPVYLMTLSYYGNTSTVQEIEICQKRMLETSGFQYNEVLKIT